MKNIVVLTLLPLLLAAPAIAQTCGPEQFTTPPDNIRVGDTFEVERRGVNSGWINGWVKGTNTIVSLTKDEIVVKSESGDRWRYDRSWGLLGYVGPTSTYTYDAATPVMSFPLTVGKKWGRDGIDVMIQFPGKSRPSFQKFSESSEVLGFEVIEVPGIGKVCTAHILASLHESFAWSGRERFGKLERWYAAELGYTVKIDSRLADVPSLRVIGYHRGDVPQS